MKNGKFNFFVYLGLALDLWSFMRIDRGDFK